MGRRHKYSERIELHCGGEAVVSSGSLSAVISVLAERVHKRLPPPGSFRLPAELSTVQHTEGTVLSYQASGSFQVLADEKNAKRKGSVYVGLEKVV